MNSRCNIGATRRGRGALASAPDLWGEDQRPDGQPRAGEGAPSAQARDAIYRFWALKVPPDHGIVTKTQRGVLRVLSQLRHREL